MQAQTSVGSTQYLLGLTRETTVDCKPYDRLGSNILLPLFDQEEYNQTMAGIGVREDPAIQKTREYNKSYYERRKQQNNSQGDPYDFVYNSLPKEHSVLKEQPPCVLCGTKKIQLKWPNLDREIVTILSRVLAPNPYVQTFQSLGNLGPLDKYRVEFTASIKDNIRVYNRPTTSEVEGNENITTYKRSIVVYGRSEYPTHIQPYFTCYDPLSYPMFFLKGEARWHKRIPREGVDTRELVDDDDDAAKDEKGQTAQDQPDLVTRVFRAKLEYLKQQLFTNNILGIFVSHIYVFEFQKCGLPHAHFLLIMRLEDKLANPDHYDKVVCVEILDPNKHPELHHLVLKHMIHGPCGHLNTQCPCMKGEPKKCRWNYPRQFQETTQQRDD
ncbi:helicase-like protein [Tanacetum coccineum]